MKRNLLLFLLITLALGLLIGCGGSGGNDSKDDYDDDYDEDITATVVVDLTNNEYTQFDKQYQLANANSTYTVQLKNTKTYKTYNQKSKGFKAEFTNIPEGNYEVQVCGNKYNKTFLVNKKYITLQVNLSELGFCRGISIKEDVFINEPNTKIKITTNGYEAADRVGNYHQYQNEDMYQVWFYFCPLGQYSIYQSSDYTGNQYKFLKTVNVKSSESVVF